MGEVCASWKPWLDVFPFPSDGVLGEQSRLCIPAAVGGQNPRGRAVCSCSAPLQGSLQQPLQSCPCELGAVSPRPAAHRDHRVRRGRPRGTSRCAVPVLWTLHLGSRWLGFTADTAVRLWSSWGTHERGASPGLQALGPGVLERIAEAELPPGGVGRPALVEPPSGGWSAVGTHRPGRAGRLGEPRGGLPQWRVVSPRPFGAALVP